MFIVNSGFKVVIKNKDPRTEPWWHNISEEVNQSEQVTYSKYQKELFEDAAIFKKLKTMSTKASGFYSSFFNSYVMHYCTDLGFAKKGF